MKIIRWWGVITFLVLSILLVAGWYLLAPMLIKDGIESMATKSMGATVDIDEVNLSLFPAGVEIRGLQATDPDQPKKNLVEIGLIQFAVDSDALFWKKIQIDELTMTEIQLGTNRETSGAIDANATAPQSSNEAPSFDLPELNQEDIESIVEKADLITLKRLKTLDESQQQMQIYWEKTLDGDANEQRINAIEVEYKRLTARAKDNKMNLLADRKDWKKLKKSISTEKKRIQQMNEQYKKDKEQLKQQIADVKAGPKADLDAVMGDIGLGNGISGLSDKFLGPEITPWIEKLIAFIGSMKSDSASADEAPVYSTDKGLMVQFKDHQLFPDLLIKKVNLSGKDDLWELSGNGSNLGYFPWLVGQPAHLNLGITGDGKAMFSMISDWKSEQKMLTQLDSKVDEWNLTNFELMKTDSGLWVVNSGKLNSKLDGELTFEKIDLNLDLTLKQPKISVPKGLSGWQKTLASSLNQQQQLNIKLKVIGSIDEPKFKISSSLDKLFNEAIGQKVQQQAEKLKGKFKDSISAKVGDISSIEKYSKDLDKWSEKLKLNDDLLDNFNLKL